MPQRRSLRLLWVALIPMLVFPLYGPTSCNRNCPPSSNPCQRAAGRSIETNQCVYVNNVDGTACSDQGVTGICSDGQCLASECVGDEFFGICDNPVGGGLVGACADDLCVLAAPQDECMKVDIGRINCCTQQGCAAASGAYCTDRLHGVSCDPTGVEPPGQTGQDGICDNGTCVAQTGLCADVACPTSVTDPCARDYCDPDIGACDEHLIPLLVPCASSGNEAVCQGGTCVAVNGNPCDDRDTCTRDLWDWENGGGCVNEYVGPQGASCTNPDGYSGQCGAGRCQPAFVPCLDKPDPDAFCDDGNECTFDECEPTLDACRSTSEPDNTLCLEDEFTGEFNGLCRYWVCLPDLCIGRDCSDGHSCTDDICIPPFGICENPTKADGEPCDGEPGQCGLGQCQPVLECLYNPGNPDQHFPQCDDGNECTFDRCNSSNQCVNPPHTFVHPCGPGGDGLCVGGNCVYL
ncbi:MAG: hypothetical protein JRH14_14110 [Deltaproteobacteria bacterium]|nr:hypothetical protein [Deltaproteobacteria bacterium]